MINVKHAPILDVVKVEELYSEKDGVPVQYVCTSAIRESAEWAADVFYRETPHPKFGNRYFALYRDPLRSNQADGHGQLWITNADIIEQFTFAMIKDKDGVYWYSSHRHDCLFIDGSMIDGGRAYVRASGDVEYFKIVDGKFVNV